MFNTQYWQLKLVYTGFGGFLMLIGRLFSLVTAERDKFGVIECTELRVVDSTGNSMMILVSYDHGGYVSVHGKSGQSGNFCANCGLASVVENAGLSTPILHT